MIDDKLKETLITELKKTLITAAMGMEHPKLERKKILKRMGDLKQIHAVLVAIHEEYAEWELSDDRSGNGKVESQYHGNYGELFSYDVLDNGPFDTSFQKWLRVSRAALIESGRDPSNLSSSGMLSLSHNMKLIVGWQEDYADQDSCILAVNETMDE
jgi:hypothetical protein